MKISYRNDKERLFYEDFKALKASYGKRMAEKIIDRIGDLVAATTPQRHNISHSRHASMNTKDKERVCIRSI